MDQTGPIAVEENIEAGAAMYQLIERLFPICRSITGDGVRETLRILQEYIPIQIHEVATGTPAFDWTVPKEWNIRDAWIRNPMGEKIVDFQSCNLHVLNYSIPVRKTLSLTELKSYLYSLPDQPDLIPYRTSYYKESWGFCVPHRLLMSLEEGDYEVMIDSSLEAGHLTYGEYFIPGETEEEVLFSCHVCHPSLANDNLSGISLAVALAQELKEKSNRYSYRFLFIPGTIGSITWLSRNEDKVSRIKHGLVITLVGDPGNITYKKSRRGDAEIDQVVTYVLEQSGQPHEEIEFFPYGYDERQYCSPGFNLPVGCLMRSQHGQYPEYHTSADNLNLVKPQYLEDSFQTYRQIVSTLEGNITYLNKYPKCEPQLGKRGLYQIIGGNNESQAMQMAMLWVLNLADGTYSLLDISKRSGIRFELIQKIAIILEGAGLLEKQMKTYSHA